MNSSKLLLSSAFAFISFLIVVATVLSVFPACNLKVFGKTLYDCMQVVDQRAPPDSYPYQDVDNLLKRIRDLEVQLATKSCAYVEYKKKEVPPPEALRKTDLDAWKRKDLGVLAGCWTLNGSEQEFVPVSCSEEGNTNCPITKSSNAVYCFDSEGVGSVKTEINGNFCKAELKAEFSQKNQLIFNELSDQMCPTGTKGSDGNGIGSLVSSNYTCKITMDSKAACDKKGRLQDTARKIILVRTPYE